MSEQWIIKVLFTNQLEEKSFSVFASLVDIVGRCRWLQSVWGGGESLSSVHSNRYSALESERSRHSGHNLTHLAWQHSPRHTAARYLHYCQVQGARLWPGVACVCRGKVSPVYCQCQCPDSRRCAAQSASSQWQGACCDITSAVLWLPLQHDFTPLH